MIRELVRFAWYTALVAGIWLGILWFVTAVVFGSHPLWVTALLAGFLLLLPMPWRLLVKLFLPH